MPGIDFQMLRDEIRMEEVLRLAGFEPTHRRGMQWYGGCPLHNCSSPRPKCFSVNIESERYFCHQCKSHGNQLDLWAAVTRLSLYPAAIHLCQMTGRQVPWIWKG